MSEARRARSERRAAARRVADSASPALPERGPRRPPTVAGMLLRVLLLALLCAAGLLLAYAAVRMSPYTAASLPMLWRAILAHGLFAALYAWNVRTASRYVPLAVSGLAAAALMAYLWRVMG